MQYPNNRETFAMNEIFFLKKNDVDVSVHCLRPKSNQHFVLLKNKHHGYYPISYYSIKTLTRIRIFLTYRNEFLYLLKFLAQSHRGQIKYALKSLALLPRVIEIFDEIKTINPSIVHLFWSHYPSLIGILVKSFLPHVKLTASFANYDIYYSFFAAHYLSSKFNACFVISSETRNSVSEMFGIPIKNLNLIHRGIEKRYLLSNPNMSKKKHSIISVGALEKAKGMEGVLNTYALVASVYPQSSLTIIGEGKSREELEKLARKNNIKNIIFRGYIDHDAVQEELSKSEIFLFLSHSEVLPNVVKEAIAARCFCVVSNTTGIGALISDQRGGIVVDARDIKGAFEGVKMAFENETFRDNCIDNSFKNLNESFVLEDTIKKMISIFRSLVANDQEVFS